MTRYAANPCWSPPSDTQLIHTIGQRVDLHVHNLFGVVIDQRQPQRFIQLTSLLLF